MSLLAQRRSYPHLPRGRAPVAQTLRSRGPRGRVRSYGGIAAAGWFAACAWFDIGGGGATRFAVGTGGAAAIAGGAELIRRRTQAAVAAPHLSLMLSSAEPRRGQELLATLRVTDPAEAGDRLEVGLICRELWDYTVRSSSTSSGPSQRSRRVTGEETAFEQWRPAQLTSLEQRIAFVVPPELPFSYEGDCLSFSWMVSVREPASGRPDRALDQAIWVLP